MISYDFAHREEGVIEEGSPLVDAENFTLTYKLKEDTYELYDEQQILYLHIHVHCAGVMSGECDVWSEKCVKIVLCGVSDVWRVGCVESE